MTNQTTPQDATQTSAFDIARHVDAAGLRCPMPLLKAKQALNSVAVGQCVRVVATDKGSVNDFHAFARLSGHKLVAFHETDHSYEYILQKAI